MWQVACQADWDSRPQPPGGRVAMRPVGEDLIHPLADLLEDLQQ